MLAGHRPPEPAPQPSEPAPQPSEPAPQRPAPGQPPVPGRPPGVLGDRSLGHSGARHRGVCDLRDHPWPGDVASHGERRQPDDQRAQAVEVAHPLEHLPGVAAHRGADGIDGVVPEDADRRADREPHAGGQCDPAGGEPADAGAGSDQHEAADDGYRPGHDVQPQALGGPVPVLIAAEGVVEIRPDERDQAAPHPKQDDQETAHGAGGARQAKDLGAPGRRPTCCAAYS